MKGEKENMGKYVYSSKRLEKAVEDTVKEWEGKTYTVKSAWNEPLRPKERKDGDAQQTVDNFRAWEDFMNQKIYVSHLIGLLTQCPNLWIDGEEVRDDCMGKFIGDILAKLADEEQKR